MPINTTGTKCTSGFKMSVHRNKVPVCVSTTCAVSTSPTYAPYCHYPHSHPPFSGFRCRTPTFPRKKKVSLNSGSPCSSYSGAVNISVKEEVLLRLPQSLLLPLLPHPCSLYKVQEFRIAPYFWVISSCWHGRGRDKVVFERAGARSRALTGREWEDTCRTSVQNVPMSTCGNVSELSTAGPASLSEQTPLPPTHT